VFSNFRCGDIVLGRWVRHLVKCREVGRKLALIPGPKYELGIGPSAMRLVLVRNNSPIRSLKKTVLGPKIMVFGLTDVPRLTP